MACVICGREKPMGSFCSVSPDCAEKNDIARLLADADDWGPNGHMGNDERHTRRASQEEADKVNELRRGIDDLRPKFEPVDFTDNTR